MKYISYLWFFCKQNFVPLNFPDLLSSHLIHLPCYNPLFVSLYLTLSLVMLAHIPHISKIMQCLSLPIWLISSLSIISSRVHPSKSQKARFHSFLHLNTPTSWRKIIPKKFLHCWKTSRPQYKLPNMGNRQWDWESLGNLLLNVSGIWLQTFTGLGKQRLLGA